MKISELLPKLHNVIATDANVIAFCQSKYQKPPTVYVAIDPKNPPNKSDYPSIFIFSIERADRGDSQKYITYDAVIGVGVFNEQLVEDGQKKTYAGAQEVEALRELVELSIFSAKTVVKAVIIDAFGQTASDWIYPLFRSDTHIRLQFMQSQEGGIY